MWNGWKLALANRLNLGDSNAEIEIASTQMLGSALATAGEKLVFDRFGL